MKRSQGDNISALDKIWSNSIAGFSQKKAELTYERFDELLGSVFCAGPFYYYVIDWTAYPAHSLSYVDDSTESFFGIGKNELSLEYVVNQVHPDDMDFVVACENLVMNFVQNEAQPEDLPFYKFTFAIRIKNKYDKYVLIQHQAMAISVTKDGKINHAINVHTDISHITSVSPRTFSIIGLSGRPSYMNIDPFCEEVTTGDQEEPFTSRELEIIRLSASGYSSKEIADRLNIATATVNTHRKNLLKKSTCSNMPEVVSKCIRGGLI